MTTEVKQTTPNEWVAWIIKEAFDIGQNAMRLAGGRFGAPMLFGLADDLSTHHANSLVFWSNQNKDASMKMVRDIVRNQRHVASAILMKSVITKEDTKRSAMSLVVRSKDGVAQMFVREVLSDGLLGPVENYDGVEGRLTEFWEISTASA